MHVDAPEHRRAHVLDGRRLTDAGGQFEFIDVPAPAANTRYYYRLRYKAAGDTDYLADVEHTFVTQRPSGSTFTFFLPVTERVAVPEAPRASAVEPGSRRGQTRRSDRAPCRGSLPPSSSRPCCSASACWSKPACNAGLLQRCTR